MRVSNWNNFQSIRKIHINAFSNNININGWNNKSIYHVSISNKIQTTISANTNYTAKIHSNNTFAHFLLQFKHKSKHVKQVCQETLYKAITKKDNHVNLHDSNKDLNLKMLHLCIDVNKSSNNISTYSNNTFFCVVSVMVKV